MGVTLDSGAQCNLQFRDRDFFRYLLLAVVGFVLRLPLKEGGNG